MPDRFLPLPVRRAGAALLGAVLLAAPAAAVPQVEVHALMRDAAVLRIGGQQRLLRKGQRSPEGVLLVSADARGAVIETDGQRHTLGLSQRIAGTFAAADLSEVTIVRNGRNEYLASGEVNGGRLLMLVDTGASMVALSAREAARLGIDFRKLGTPGRAGPAGGVVNAWQVKLDRVSVGGITVHHVPAMVLEGEHPQHLLLGMTYLEHVNLREQEGVMVLQQKY